MKKHSKPRILYQIDTEYMTRYALREQLDKMPNSEELEQIEFYLTTDRILFAVVNQIIHLALEDLAEENYRPPEESGDTVSPIVADRK